METMTGAHVQSVQRVSERKGAQERERERERERKRERERACVFVCLCVCVRMHPACFQWCRRVKSTSLGVRNGFARTYESPSYFVSIATATYLHAVLLQTALKLTAVTVSRDSEISRNSRRDFLTCRALPNVRASIYFASEFDENCKSSKSI